MNDFRQLLDFCKNSFGTKNAIKYLKGDEIKIKTFVELYIDVMEKVQFWDENGEKNKKIAIIGSTTYEWISSYYGIVCSGNIMIPIDRMLSNDKIVEFLLLSEADIILYESNLSSKIEKILKSLSIAVQKIEIGKDKRKKNRNDCMDVIDIDENQTAVMLFTSGTTGDSKLVVLSHKNLCSNVQYVRYLTRGVFRETEDMSTIIILPTHHAFAITVGINFPLYIGMTICIGKGVQFLTESISIFKPSMLALVPMFIEKMYKQIVAIQKKKQEKSTVLKEIFGENLDIVFCGGAFLDSTIVESFNKWGIKLWNGYGITECGPVISGRQIEPYNYSSVGMLEKQDFCKVKIVEGEILVSGLGIMKEYYQDSEATEQVLCDGWFKTGDLGYIDEDGYLYITGRKKNLIILNNGENISPEELEMYFSKLELIKEIIIYSKKFNGQEILYAEIVADLQIVEERKIDNVKDEMYKEIWKLNKTLPNYKQIKRFTILDNMDKSSLGKIKRGGRND